MSVQRIDSDSTHGWQARAHLAAGKRLTRFFSDGVNGGWTAALARAVREEQQLKRRARELLDVHGAKR